MEYSELKFRGGIWKYGEKWCNSLKHGVSKDLLILEFDKNNYIWRNIEENKLIQKEIEKLKAIAENNVEFKQKIKDNIDFIKEFETLINENKDNYEIQIEEDTIINGFEKYIFSIKGYNIKFYVDIKNKNTNVYNFVFMPGNKNSIFIEKIEEFIGKEKYDLIMKTLLNNKSIRIRRILKN